MGDAVTVFSFEVWVTQAPISAGRRRDVLNQCYGQREMVKLLRTWLLTNQDPASVDLALAMVCAFSDALPE